MLGGEKIANFIRGNSYNEKDVEPEDVGREYIIEIMNY